MAKYRFLDPRSIAERAWSNWAAKTDTMIARYAEAVRRAAADPASREAYTAKVATWITIMRSPEVRQAIASAIQAAKSRYYGMVRPVAQEQYQYTVART